MSTAQYGFYPWVRRGLAKLISNKDSNIPLPNRSTVTIKSTVHAESVTATPILDKVCNTDVNLYGPGDIIGIDQRHIIRTEPRHLTTNFEPNYFAAIEFNESDFPWMFTPAAPDADKLRPWICLVVLTDDEYTQSKTTPLPTIDVKDVVSLPDLKESWAWAHTQVSGQDDVSDVLATDPTRVISRILCPRKLQPDTKYAAFLVPAFDLGVKAGKGEKIPDVTITVNKAWVQDKNDPECPDYMKSGNKNVTLPVYYQFEFHTSDLGDFESLVRQLTPRKDLKDVGLRPMDMNNVGWGFQKPSSDASLVNMGGAMHAADTSDSTWPNSYTNYFQTNIQKLLNDTIPSTDDPLNPNPNDPHVGPPLYGRWHAKVKQIDPAAKGWINDLNLDPRRRIAAGFGTKVVLAQRTQLMTSAWKQVAGIEKLNQKLRNGQVGTYTLQQMHTNRFQSMDKETMLAIASPVLGKIPASPYTVQAAISKSQLPLRAFSGTFRRLARPLGSLRRRQGGTMSPYKILTHLNEKGMMPPLHAPGGLVSLDQVSDNLYPKWIPKWMQSFLPNITNILFILAGVVPFLILLFGFFTGLLPITTAIAAVVGGAVGTIAIRLHSVLPTSETATALRVANLTPQNISKVPPRPNFHLVTSDQSKPSASVSSGDSHDAKIFRGASKMLTAYIQSLPKDPPLPPVVDMVELHKAVMHKLDPTITVPQRIKALIQVDPKLNWNPNVPLDPIMAAPTFPFPMYAPLRDISQDLVLPGIKNIPPNSLALVEQDRAFIEAYMVGLNHEMARQLLWNEYPTDQRGSYFRQFWDVSTYVRTNIDPPEGSDELREKLYDIPQIHTWTTSNSLGTNVNAKNPAGSNLLVLLVRGELLRRYPNANIYACEAKLDANKKRTPSDNEKNPLFRGTFSPDITFFGFDLTEDQARGKDPSYPQGWFFVFQQQVSEPRFGLEPDANGAIPNITQWADISWSNFPGAKFAPLGNNAPVSGLNLVINNDNKNDQNNSWGINAAQTAYITMRRPARVAVHAEMMLPQSTGGGG